MLIVMVILVYFLVVYAHCWYQVTKPEPETSRPFKLCYDSRDNFQLEVDGITHNNFFIKSVKVEHKQPSVSLDLVVTGPFLNL